MEEINYYVLGKGIFVFSSSNKPISIGILFKKKKDKKDKDRGNEINLPVFFFKR